MAADEVGKRVLGALKSGIRPVVDSFYSIYSEFAPIEVDAWPPSLRPVAAIALAYAREYVEAFSEPGDLTRFESDSPVFKVERALIRLENANGPLQAIALRSELEALADQAAKDLVEAVPWFLALDDLNHERLIVGLALRSAEVRTKLDEIHKKHKTDLGLRARGLYLSVTTGDSATLNSAYMWHMDHHLHSVPKSLAAPTRTWLGDTTLEDEVENRANTAVSKLMSLGLSEETEVTGALVERLVAAFMEWGPLPQTMSWNPPVSLNVTSTNSRTHEKLYGADLGITMKVVLPGRLVVETGHLVQIKQAENRERIDQPPRWVIDRSQLAKILEADQTATYWLIQLHRDPKVLSVSAKYLHGVIASREDKVGKAATIQYEDVRSASNTLGNELGPLLMGLWIGETDSETVNIAQGHDSRHVPAQLLTLRIRADG